MSRLIAPDGGLKGVDISTPRGTKKYNVDKRGGITVENPSHAAKMKDEGFFEASLMGPTTNSAAIGYTCNECGFGSWFIKCGRCGHENDVIKKDGD
jgi:hypothetical protein